MYLFILVISNISSIPIDSQKTKRTRTPNNPGCRSPKSCNISFVQAGTGMVPQAILYLWGKSHRL